MGSPLTWTIEIARARRAGNPHAFEFERQHYNFRGKGGVYGNAEFPWDEALPMLAELQRPHRSSEVAHRLGELLRAFLEAGLATLEGWSAFEATIIQAEQEGRPLHVTLRFGAAELYRLPWELTTLRSSGEHLGKLSSCVIHYEWPGVRAGPTISTPSEVPGRLLFGWSAAGGDVPAGRHQQALERASSRGNFTFVASRDTVPRLSASSLRDSLRKATEEGQPFSALHLLCHGGRDANGSHGLLWNGAALEDGATLVDAEELGGALSPYRDALRLVVLCACNSGNAGVPGNVLGSVAQELHRLGIPAVVASRLALSVEGSVLLTESFHGAWDGSSRVQPALRMARRALVEAGGYDWASIQLFSAPGDEGMGRIPVPRWRPAVAGVLLASVGVAAAMAIVAPFRSPAPVDESTRPAADAGPVLEEQLLAGRVWNEDGEPVAGATVSMVWAGRKVSTTTDASGLFQLRAQAEHQVSVRVVVELRGYSPSEYPATLGNTELGLTLERNGP